MGDRRWQTDSETEIMLRVPHSCSSVALSDLQKEIVSFGAIRSLKIDPDQNTLHVVFVDSAVCAQAKAHLGLASNAEQQRRYAERPTYPQYQETWPPSPLSATSCRQNSDRLPCPQSTPPHTAFISDMLSRKCPAKPSLWVRGSDFSFLFDDDTETSSSPTIGSFSSAFESPTLESGLNQSMLSPHGTDKDYQNDCFYRTPAQVPNPQSVNADESYLLDHHFEKKQPRNALPLAPYGDKYALQVDGFRAQSQARVSPCEPVFVNQSFSSEMHKNPPTQTSYQTCKKKEMSLGSSGELHWSPLRCQTGLSLLNTSRCDSSDRHQQDSGICFDSELNGTGFGFMNAELLGSNLGKFEWRSDQKLYNELPPTPNSSGPHSTDGEQVFFPDSPWNQYSELNSANLRQDTPSTNNDSASWKYYRENRLYSSVAKSPEGLLSPVQDSMKPPRLNCRVDTEATGQISPVTPSGREWPMQKKAHEQWRRTVSEKSNLHLQDSTYPPLTAERCEADKASVTTKNHGSRSAKLSNPAMPTTKLAAIPESSQASPDGDTMYCETSFNLRSIALGKDKRTAVMLKNVPNRYTQDMLLEFVNETHKGTYDFFYLRMDFVNNCNVGYAFIKYDGPIA
ncbi:hypothetical protein HDU78_008463 [Chytriomyces hyalinus]|nr:hypothetical protein HDU78_008463 [Chytriomyces hyalinus]